MEPPSLESLGLERFSDNEEFEMGPLFASVSPYSRYFTCEITVKGTVSRVFTTMFPLNQQFFGAGLCVINAVRNSQRLMADEENTLVHNCVTQSLYKQYGAICKDVAGDKYSFILPLSS